MIALSPSSPGWLRKNVAPLWHRIVDRILEGGIGALVVALLLLAVPTAYTLFAPEIVAPVAKPKSLSIRLVVGAIWLLAAGIAFFRQREIDRRVSRLVGGRSNERVAAVQVAVDEILGSLVHSGSQGTPEDFVWTVFIFDTVRGALVPLYPAVPVAEEETSSFKPGEGATGQAFADGGVVVAIGDTVSNDAYGLSPDKQSRYSSYRSVASAPLIWEGTSLGSLSTIATTENPYFQSPAGRAIILKLADTVAAVLAVMMGFGTAER